MLCDTCERLRKCKPELEPVLATHSVDDVSETEPGVFVLSGKRHGCQKHRVASMVHTLAGDTIPYKRFAA